MASVATRRAVGTVATVLRQRLAAHEHPVALADALEVVPRSAPFHSFEELGAIGVPTLVVASRDEADPGHPLAVGTDGHAPDQAGMPLEGNEFLGCGRIPDFHGPVPIP